MNAAQRTSLDSLLSQNDVEDCTQSIRERRHSPILKAQAKALSVLVAARREAGDEPDPFDGDMIGSAPLLFSTYTDIYNRIVKSELDLKIFMSLLDALGDIEAGELDQHEGSFKAGQLLKELYVDSALKKADKLDADAPPTKPKRRAKDISWGDYKLSTGA